MTRARWAAFALLAAYSAALAGLEWATCQEDVRPYYSDVEGPNRLYAVNTTLSVSLLWGSALLFGVSFVAAEGLPEPGRRRRLALSLAAAFFVLGCDDRFKAHEWLGWKLGVVDIVGMLFPAVLLAGGLALFGGRWMWQGRTVAWFAAACVLTAAMLFFDNCVPHDMVLRLSAEDLAKTWAAACFFLFAWEICTAQIRRGHAPVAATE